MARELEELRRAADAAERILDLVGEAADQLARSPMLRKQQFIARDAQVAVQRHALHQQPAALAEQDGRDRTVQRDRLACAPQRHLALDEAGAGIERNLQTLGVRGERRDRLQQGFAQGVPATNQDQANKLFAEDLAAEPEQLRRATAGLGVEQPGEAGGRPGACSWPAP